MWRATSSEVADPALPVRACTVSFAREIHSTRAMNPDRAARNRTADLLRVELYPKEYRGSAERSGLPGCLSRLAYDVNQFLTLPKQPTHTPVERHTEVRRLLPPRSPVQWVPYTRSTAGGPERPNRRLSSKLSPLVGPGRIPSGPTHSTGSACRTLRNQGDNPSLARCEFIVLTVLTGATFRRAEVCPEIEAPELLAG